MGMKHFCCLQKYMVISRKSTPASELQAELAILFMQHHFYLTRMLRRHFLVNEMSLPLQGKLTVLSAVNDKTQAFKQKPEF